VRVLDASGREVRRISFIGLTTRAVSLAASSGDAGLEEPAGPAKPPSRFARGWPFPSSGRRHETERAVGFASF
jgi:hypothetical protein